MVSRYLPKALRPGVALAIAGCMLLPMNTAAAAPDTSQPEQTRAASSVTTPSAARSSDGKSANGKSRDVDSLLTPVTKDGARKTNGLLADTSQTSTGEATIIVQLDNTTAGVPWYRSLFGVSKQTRHEYIKNDIRDLASKLPASAAGSTTKGKAESSAPKVQDVADYYHAIDGFAVKAPASLLGQIRALAGVKRAFIEQRHAIPDEKDTTAATPDLKNQSSLDMTAADKIAQRGDGQTIAIIDSGLDTAHEAFKGDLDDAKVKETRAGIDATIKELGHGKYVSEKIPFAYDYADNDNDVTPSDLAGMEHGTHVAGIAAANSGDQIRGTAPNAQILAMKVADDFSGGIDDSALLGAIDDAAALDADTVNMSLGSDAGFSEESTATYGDAMKTLRQSGATVNVAAGNAATAASGNRSGKNLPFASDPDSSVISSPASFGDAFAVASVNNAQPQSAFLSPEGKAIGYNLLNFATADGQSTGKTTPDFYDGDHTLADGTYEVVDGGIGSTEDQTRLANAYNWDLSGKIVLVKRGGNEPTDGHALTFTDKLLNVGTAVGAAAVIFYNNTDGSLTNAAIADGTVVNYPVVAISGKEGQALLKAQRKEITLKKGTTATPNDYAMSDFTSWGVTPDLKLKPEITAPGGNIWSSVPGDKYEYMSGTSMATPQMAGISAQIHEYVDSDEKFKNLSDAAKSDVVTQLLMSTAKPVASGDSYASPRQQGAGLANAEAAVKTPVYLTVDGADDASRPKADIGESADGSWKFTLTLHNLGGKSSAYKPDAQALSEQVADGLLQTTDSNWTGKGIAVSYSGSAYDAKTGVVTVPANGTAKLTVSVKAESAFKTYVSKNLPNGTFVEGFAILRAADGNGSDATASGVDLSAPFVGFYGDWSKAPVFDSALWQKGDNAYHIYGTALASKSTGVPLGVNPLDEDATAGPVYAIDPAKMVVSRSNYSLSPSEVWPVTGLLRNADKLTYDYTDGNGKVVRSYSYDHVSKSTLNVTSNAVLYAEARIGSGAGAFDGKDNDGKNLPDGTYTLQQTATTAGPGSERQKSSAYSIALDTEGPKIGNMKLSGTGDDKTFSFDATDSTWLSAIDFHDPVTGAYFKRVLAGDDYTTNADGTKTWHFTVKVADIKAAWSASGLSGDLPNSVPLYAWDYGVNPSAKADAVMAPVAATGITLSKSALTIAPGQKAKIDATVQPETSTEKELDWTSADPTKVTVDDAGNLTGVAPSEGKPVAVTASSKLNPAVKAVVQVTVADVSDSTGIVMAQDSATVEPGASIDVTALVAPSLTGKTISWTSSDETIATVSAKGGQTAESEANAATVTAGDQVGATTITASVDGKSATMEVKVQPADFDQFVFDKDGTTLLGYTGNARDIVIPNNTKAIDYNAFVQTAAVTITVPYSVETIGTEAFAHTGNLTEVKFENTAKHPSRLKSIADKAFTDNAAIDTVNLPVNIKDFKLGDDVFSDSTLRHVTLPASLTEIPAGTFSADPQLTDVTISKDTTVIGANAFNADIGLGEFKLVDGDGTIVKGWPSQLKTIGDGALVGTAFTGTITLPKSLRSIGASALQLVKADFVLNDGLESIGNAAFGGTLTTRVDMPDSLKSVGASAFANIDTLTDVTVGRNVPDRALIGVFANTPKLSTFVAKDGTQHYSVADGVLFDKNGTTLIAYPNANAAGPKGGVYTVPSAVTEIAPYALYLNGSLKTVNFNEGLKTIGDSAFLQSALSAVALPKSLEKIDHSAFMNMAKLTSVDFGGTISVGGSAFYGDTALTDLNMRPDLGRLKSFGSLAFGQATAITALDFPDSVTDLGGDAFTNITGLKSVHLGAGITSGVEGVFTGANGLTTITVSEKNPVFSATGDVLYQKQQDGLHLVLSAPGNPLTEYTVKDGTVAIDAQAFRNNHALKTITLPASLKTTDTGAFNSADALERVVFPDGFERTKSSFLFASKLEYVEFGTKTKAIEDEFWGHRPTHLVVRGGVDGSYSGGIIAGGMQTAYFGKGMTNIDISDAPSIVVVPEDLKTLKLEGTGVVYAPEGSDGFKAAAAAVGDSRVKAYTPLSVKTSIDGGTAAGTTATVKIVASGGVDGERQYRIVTTGVDGKETVLQDWTDMKSDGTGEYAWSVPDDADDLSLSVDVRDATWYTASSEAKPAASDALRKSLVDAIASAKQISQGTKVDSAFKALQDAIAAAQKVADNSKATSAQLRTASQALDKAVQAFHAAADKPGKDDIAALDAAIAEAKAIRQGTKTDAAFKALQDAIDAAQKEADKVSSGEEVTQAEVVSATAALKDAVRAFQASADRPAPVDKSRLDAAIAEAKAIRQGAKTDRAFKALQDAIAAAQKVADDDKADQEAVTAAVDELRSAVAAFKASADVAVTNPGDAGNKGDNTGTNAGTANKDGAADGLSSTGVTVTPLLVVAVALAAVSLMLAAARLRRA